jgi:hypothetical protein
MTMVAGPSDPATWKGDAVPTATVALVAGIAAWVAFRMLDPALLHVSTFDFWFESDAPAIAKQLSDRFALDHDRANRHPLFALILYPVLYVLRRVVHLDTPAALGVTYAGLAALWSGMFFGFLRLTGLRRREAMLFTTLALCSASAIFWLPVPETFAPAALTLLIALAALAWHEQTGRLSWIACVLIAAVTVSMTLTNGVAGFCLCLVVLGWKRGLLAFGSALVVVAAAQVLEHSAFPHTTYFFLPVSRESAYLFNPLAGSLADRLAGFFLRGMVLPPMEQGYAGYLSVQQSSVTSAPLFVVLAWVLWGGLLVAGVTGLMRSGRARLRITLVAVLVSQLVLALVFGQETFVYALQSGPLLVALAAFGAFTPQRRWVLGGAALLVALAAVVNIGRFSEAARLLHHRHDYSRAYAQALLDRTGVSELVVLGLPPASSQGLVAPAVRQVRDPRPLDRVPRFDSLRIERQGWQLMYEHWSEANLDQMRRAGARYFATAYSHGLRNSSAVRGYLEAHGTPVVRTPDWAIYALRPPADSAR